MKNTGNLKLSTPTECEIVMSRVFDAPRRLVFDALTKPELLKRWFSGPPGWSLVECEVDLKVGGSYRYVWHSPEGIKMGLSGTFREVVAPELYVATEKFDEAWYPGEAIGRTELAEDAGKTTVTMTIQYDSRETRDAVLKTPMEDGVAYGYDKLEELLMSLLSRGESQSGD